VPLWLQVAAEYAAVFRFNEGQCVLFAVALVVEGFSAEAIFRRLIQQGPLLLLAETT